MMHGQTKIKSYYELVCVDLHVQHAARMRHIVFCGLSGPTIIFRIISLTAQLSKNVIEHKTCFNFLNAFYLQHFSIQAELSEI